MKIHDEQISFRKELSDIYLAEKTNLVTILNTEECVAFFGSGLSKPCSYPLWADIINKLEDEFNILNPNNTIPNDLNLIDKAQFFRNNLGEENYFNIIKSLFNLEEKRHFSDVYTYLADLNFICYLTTNFDECFENVLQEKRINYQAFFHPQPQKIVNRTITVCHLHGVIKPPYEDKFFRNIVFTQKDYLRAYETSGILSLFLQQLLLTNRFFFFGFSFEDKYIKNILEIIIKTKKIHLETYTYRENEELFARENFAFIGFEEFRYLENKHVFLKAKNDFLKNLKTIEKLGIKIIPYFARNHEHTELINILRDLVNKKFSLSNSPTLTKLDEINEL